MFTDEQVTQIIVAALRGVPHTWTAPAVNDHLQLAAALREFASELQKKPEHQSQS